MAEANARIARVDAWLIPGLGRTIAITNANGTDWPVDTFVHFGPLSATTGEVVPTIAAVTAAVVGPVATITLTEANVAAIRTAYPSSGVARCPWHIRTGSGAGEVAHATGFLGWDLTGSAQSATAVATVVVGPPGISVAGMAVDGDTGSETYGHLLTTMSDTSVYDSGDVLGLSVSLATAADASADAAAASAGTATTKAGEASASAADALASQSAASGSAGTATTQAGNASTSAGTATTQAGISTTKAGESASSAAAALVSENNAAATLANAVVKTTIDAKGDLLAGTANDTIARLAVGATGTILVADSNQATGIGWQSPIPVVRNMLANSNFVGTTSWAGVGGTIAAASNTLTATGDGSGASVGASQSITSTAGRIYYIRCTARVTNASSTGIVINAFGATTTVKASPASNAWYALSVRGVSLADTTTVAVQASYADAATASGKATAIQYVTCLDLTAIFGAGREPVKSEMDAYMERAAIPWLADTAPQLWSGADWLKLTQNSCRNLISNGDFSAGVTGWTATTATQSAAAGEVTILASAANGGIARPADAGVSGNTYYVAASVKATSAAVRLAYSGTVAYHSGGGTYERLSLIRVNTVAIHSAAIADTRASGWDNIYAKNFITIDLTATFGAGNEPTLSEMDYLLSRYSDSWFNGTVNNLVSAQKHYLRDRIGSGSPEGVITAPVGTGYTDIAVTLGAEKWIKSTGTGNTGWIVSVGDTGWRDVSASLTAGYLTANPNAKMYVRRTNGVVWWSHYTGASNTANGVTSIYTIAAGWKPGATGPVAIGSGYVEATKAASGTTLYPSSATALSTYTNGGTPTKESLRYPVVDTAPWPTSLPGSAV